MTELKEFYRMSRDAGDEWGDCVSALFSVAAEMYFREIGPPDDWRYKPGAACTGDPREEDSLWGPELKDTTDEDLCKFGALLMRYRGMLKHAEKDY